MERKTWLWQGLTVSRRCNITIHSFMKPSLIAGKKEDGRKRYFYSLVKGKAQTTGTKHSFNEKKKYNKKGCNFLVPYTNLYISYNDKEIQQITINHIRLGDESSRHSSPGFNAAANG